MTVESLVLGCLLLFAVLLEKLALFVVILLHSLQLQLHRCLLQARHHSGNLQQHCGTQVGALQSPDQSAARKLFYRPVVHLMVDRYFGHVDLKRFLAAVILVDPLVVIAALVGPSDSADTAKKML